MLYLIFVSFNPLIDDLLVCTFFSIIFLGFFSTLSSTIFLHSNRPNTLDLNFVHRKKCKTRSSSQYSMKDNQFANEMRIPSASNEYQQLTAYSALRFAALRVSSALELGFWLNKNLMILRFIKLSGLPNEFEVQLTL